MQGSTSTIWYFWNDMIACAELLAFPYDALLSASSRMPIALPIDGWKSRYWLHGGLQLSCRKSIQSTQIAMLFNLLPILANQGKHRMMSMHVRGPDNMLTQVKTNSMQLKCLCLSYSNDHSSWGAHHQSLDLSQRLSVVGEREPGFREGGLAATELSPIP